MLGVIGFVVAIVIGLALLGMVIEFWKVVAATIIGTLFAGPVGGVIGFIIGLVTHNTSKNKQIESVSDSKQNSTPRQEAPFSAHQSQGSQSSSSQSNITIESLIPIIRLVCYFSLKQDGQWTTDKVQYVKKTFEEACETSEDFELLQTLMKSKDQNEDEIIQQFIQMRPDDDLRQNVFLHCAMALNYNDYSDHDMERILIKLGRQLNLHESVFKNIINGFKRSSHQQSQDRSQHRQSQSKNSSQIEWAYGILELNKNATEKEVQRAFRVKISQYHPDKNQNVTETVQQLLNQKSRELQEARDLLLAHVAA